MQSGSTMISKYKQLLPWPHDHMGINVLGVSLTSMWHEMIKVVIILFDTKSPTKLLITPYSELKP